MALALSISFASMNPWVGYAGSSAPSPAPAAPSKEVPANSNAVKVDKKHQIAKQIRLRSLTSAKDFHLLQKKPLWLW